MFFPLENTYAPFSLVLISITVRATNSFFIQLQACQHRIKGRTKYRQMGGMSVISG